MPWSPISSCPTNACRLPPYPINHRNVIPPPKSIQQKERSDAFILQSPSNNKPFAFARADRQPQGRGQQNYIHKHSSSEHKEVSLGNPAQPGFAGKEVRHSRKRSRTPSPQVTLQGLQGCHGLHVSANTQAHSNEECVCLLTFKDTAICLLLFKKNSSK